MCKGNILCNYNDVIVNYEYKIHRKICIKSSEITMFPLKMWMIPTIIPPALFIYTHSVQSGQMQMNIYNASANDWIRTNGFDCLTFAHTHTW